MCLSSRVVSAKLEGKEEFLILIDFFVQKSQEVLMLL